MCRIDRPLPVLHHVEEPVRRDRARLEFEPSLQRTTGTNDERPGVIEELGESAPTTSDG